jgi:hypothetical protein
MKLGDIVDYLNLLDSVSVKAEADEAMRKLMAVLHIVVNHELQSSKHTQDLQNTFDTTNNCLERFQTVLEDIKHHLRSQIEIQEPEYFRESTRRFLYEMPFETTEYILNRRMNIDDASNIELRSLIRMYSDWKLPGLIFRPGLETFIEEMVPLDPLYVVDNHQDLLTPSVSKFKYEYQRRIRQYVVDDRTQDSILKQLPDNQFGFVFAYNYMNFKPMEVVKRYMFEVYQKMRPGGNFIMTYNNCDQAHGVRLAERAWMTYTPLRMIRTYSDQIGFDIVREYTGLGDVSWVEFRKPGTIESLRGGQNLAKIFAKP